MSVWPDFLKGNTASFLRANMDCSFLLTVKFKETHEKTA